MQNLTHLIDQCIAGDQKSQRELYDYLKGRLMGICIRYHPIREDAKDVFQEAMVRVFKNLDRAQKISDFNAWTSRIAINVSIDAFRKRKMDLTVNIEESNVQEFSSDDLGVIGKMNAEEIICLLEHLPESQRIAFNMFIDGYSHKEIGKKLSIVESSSRTLLTRAKKKMIVLLKGENK